MSKKVIVKKRSTGDHKQVIVSDSPANFSTEKRVSSPITRFPKTDEELWWWVYATWGVKIPRTRVCPDHVAPFEAFADAFFARAPVMVWKASRGFGGKTNLISLLGMSELVALGAFVTILGGSGAQSLRVHETMQEAWHYSGAPRELLLKDPTKFDTYLTNGGKARTLMASTKSVRGPHPQRMRLDEIDEMEMNVLTSAQGQPMRKKNHIGEILETNTVMSSTHQYPDGTMTQILKRAKENNWPVYQWCISEGSFVTTKRGDVPIESLRSDDFILTRFGFRRIQHLTNMGVKEVITLTFDDGRTLTCTPDHLLCTPAGWVPADSTLAVTSILPDVPLRITAPGTDEGSLSVSPRPSGVSSHRDAFKVSDSDAEFVSTNVINVMTIRNRAVNGNPNEDVSVDGSPFTIFSNFLDSVSIAGSTSPENAGSVDSEQFGWHTTHNRVVSVETSTPVVVYDIGVEDAHEFTANGFVVHNCWKETSNPVDGWLTLEEVSRKREEIPLHMWEAEYDLQEPSFEGRAIDERAVEIMFDPELGYAEAAEGKYIEINKPKDNRDYITGVDWAKSKDYTVIWTFDVTDEPWQTVAFERIRRRPWPAMVDRLNQRWELYGGKVAHDATGIGSVVNDYIVVPKNARPRDLHGIIMAGRVRSDMITNYVSAVEKHLLKAPRLQFPFEEHKFVTPDDLYNGSASAHLPDTIAAGALAWSLRNTWKRISTPVDISMKRERSPWKIGR